MFVQCSYRGLRKLFFYAGLWFIDDADSIDEQSIQETEFSESQVQITWNEPSSPNGLIATYHIHLIPVVSA